MNNNDMTIQKEKQISKREVRGSALILFAVGIFCLTYCVYAYIKSDYLQSGAALNPDTVNTMREIIKVASFVVIPALSVLLILSSRLIWKLSNKLDAEKDSK